MTFCYKIITIQMSPIFPNIGNLVLHKFMTAIVNYKEIVKPY